MLDDEIKTAEGDQKTFAPHRDIGTLMTTALNQFVTYFLPLWTFANSSLMELLWIKAQG